MVVPATVKMRGHAGGKQSLVLTLKRVVAAQLGMRSWLARKRDTEEMELVRATSSHVAAAAVVVKQVSVGHSS